jgi:hypothetical protein
MRRCGSSMRTEFCRRIGLALLKPYFKPAVEIEADEIDSSMASGTFAFDNRVAAQV